MPKVHVIIPPTLSPLLGNPILLESRCHNIIIIIIIITPRACARGKVIGRVVVVVSTKIAISRDVGIQAARKHNELIEFGEKLASMYVKSRDTVHKRHK